MGGEPDKPEGEAVKSHWAEVFDLTQPEAREERLPGPDRALAERPGITTRVACIDYSPQQYLFEEVCDIPTFLARHRPAWSVVRWIHISGPIEPETARAFADKYELHPLAIEDVMQLDQRPKAEDFAFSEEHPGRLFIIARAVERVSQHVVTEQVSFFLGRKTLVSFEEDEANLLAAVKARLEDGNSRLRQNDVSFLLYSLVDFLVDSFFPIMEEISAHLDEIETSVLQGSRENMLPDIYLFRRDLSLLRRVAWPMRELIFKLHRESHVCLSDTTSTYLRDVYDHLVQVLDLIETYREFADSLTQTYMSVVSNRMNDIVKTLTIVSTIFVPLTFLAGVYGMNMPIPENHHDWTYPFFWVFSVGVAGVMLYLFRRREWL